MDDCHRPADAAAMTRWMVVKLTSTVQGVQGEIRVPRLFHVSSSVATPHTGCPARWPLRVVQRCQPRGEPALHVYCLSYLL